MNVLFVYGTLMRARHNNHILGRDLLNEYLAGANTEPQYTLFDGLGAPYMTDAGRDRVVGELFMVTDATLEFLDRFEGHPNLYRRKVVRIEGWKGPAVFGYVYQLPLMNPPMMPGNDGKVAWRF